METNAILFVGAGEVSLGAVTVPEPGPGEILIEAAFTAVSPGTEKRCLAGMQVGAPPFPFVPGYSLVGRVLRSGSGTTLAPGTPVLCAGTSRVAGASRLWGGHIAHAVRAESEVHVLPEGLALDAAPLARLAAIPYHGLRLARPRPHERVAVVGLGLIGLLAARLYATAGCRVVGIDPQESRRALLSDAVATIDEAKECLMDGADIVVDATGVPSVLPQSITLARDLPWGDHNEEGARIVLQGSYPEAFSLPYDGIFTKEATLLVPRDNQSRDVRSTVDLFFRKQLVLSDLATTFPAEDAPSAYARLTAPASDLLTAVFKW
jgi:3-hydroxyethyl bacteriochlorophyllide a dehydrogenase